MAFPTITSWNLSGLAGILNHSSTYHISVFKLGNIFTRFLSHLQQVLSSGQLHASHFVINENDHDAGSHRSLKPVKIAPGKPSLSSGFSIFLLCAYLKPLESLLKKLFYVI